MVRLWRSNFNHLKNQISIDDSSAVIFFRSILVGNNRSTARRNHWPTSIDANYFWFWRGWLCRHKVSLSQYTLGFSASIRISYWGGASKRPLANRGGYHSSREWQWQFPSSFSFKFSILGKLTNKLPSPTVPTCPTADWVHSKSLMADLVDWGASRCTQSHTVWIHRVGHIFVAVLNSIYFPSRRHRLRPSLAILTETSYAVDCCWIKGEQLLRG